MRLKNLNETPHGGFQFFFFDLKGNEIQVPGRNQQRANSISQVANMVRRNMSNLGMQVPDDLEIIIQHQICLRMDSPLEYCYEDGIGDKLHHEFMKPFLKNVAGAVEKVSKPAAKAVRKVAGCQKCGGTRTYKQGARNLGRAGVLNSLYNPNAKRKAKATIKKAR